MCEKSRWGVYGLLLGMGISAVIVATNKKVQKTISDGTEKVSEKFHEVKDAATKKIKSMKKKPQNTTSSNNNTSKNS